MAGLSRCLQRMHHMTQRLTDLLVQVLYDAALLMRRPDGLHLGRKGDVLRAQQRLDLTVALDHLTLQPAEKDTKPSEGDGGMLIMDHKASFASRRPCHAAQRLTGARPS